MKVLFLFISIICCLFIIGLLTQQRQNNIPSYELTLSVKMKCEECIRDSTILDTINVFTSNNKPYCYLDNDGNLRNGEEYIIARKVLVYNILNIRKTQ